MDWKSMVVGIVMTLVVIGGISGIVYGVSQADPIDSPFSQSTPTPEPVNESELSPQAQEHQEDAGALARELQKNYDYEFRVFISGNNVTTVKYTSQAEDPDMLKYEMKEIALLYAQVAADNENVGSLVLSANGITLTVPDEIAITRGNGGMNDEEYFKHVRWDGEEE